MLRALTARYLGGATVTQWHNATSSSPKTCLKSIICEVTVKYLPPIYSQMHEVMFLFHGGVMSRQIPELTFDIHLVTQL